jgi:hypothetical protein
VVVPVSDPSLSIQYGVGVGRLPGDELIPDAGVVLDRTAAFDCPADVLWPWIVQLGKGRAGWYLPGWLELVVSRRRRGLRVVEPRWQELRPGDVVPDFGPGRPTFTVVSIEAPHALVYRSCRPRRRGDPLEFTWALVVEPIGPQRCRLRLRLRTRSLGRRFPRIVTLGADLIDRATVGLMVAGLRTRVRT